jgi:hypothetical protein
MKQEIDESTPLHSATKRQPLFPPQSQSLKELSSLLVINATGPTPPDSKDHEESEHEDFSITSSQSSEAAKSKSSGDSGTPSPTKKSPRDAQLDENIPECPGNDFVAIAKGGQFLQTPSSSSTELTSPILLDSSEGSPPNSLSSSSDREKDEAQKVINTHATNTQPLTDKDKTGANLLGDQDESSSEVSGIEFSDSKNKKDLALQEGGREVNSLAPSSPQEASLGLQLGRPNERIASTVEHHEHNGFQGVSAPSLAQDNKGKAEFEELPNPPSEGNFSKFQRLLDGDDPENEKRMLLIQVDEKDLSPAARAFLLHAHYIFEGKPTWRQIGVGALGIPIGVGVMNAMPPIFIKSLYNLGPIYLDIITTDDITTGLFISHTAISLGIDSIARNVRILGELAGPSIEEFSVPKSRKAKNIQRALLVFTYGSAGIAALLPVYYLWDAEGEHLKKHPEDRNSTLVFFGCLAVPLFLDSCLVISRAAKNWIDEKINDNCIRQAYNDQLSKAHILRQQELNRFQDLAHLFEVMDDEEIRKAYTNVYTKHLHATKSDVSLSEEQAKILDAVHTLRALRQLHKGAGNDSTTIEQDSENWRTTKNTELGNTHHSKCGKKFSLLVCY